MIAAAFTYGPSLLSPFVASPIPSPLSFDHYPEYPPVTKSVSMESIESMGQTIEISLEEKATNLETAGSESPSAILTPKQNLNTSATTPKQLSARRVIFPELHQERRAPPSPEKTKPTSPVLRKLASFDSSITFDSSIRADEKDSLRALVSTKCSAEESPRCVSAINTDMLVPPFGPASGEARKIDPSLLIIPPFVSRTESSHSLQQEEQLPVLAPATNTPAYKKRLASPFANSFHKMHLPVTQKLPGHLVIQSILRKKVDSMPSMVSMSSSEASLPDLPRRVGFDPRVWVREFQRDKAEYMQTWFSPSEMDRFKRHAIERIHAYSGALVPTGTGRLVQKPITSKAFFTHPALSGTDDEDVFAIQKVAHTEINNILVVDPHDLCAKLFAKLFRQLLPHVTVVTAKSSQEAMKRIEQSTSKKSFDIILVEERLKLVQDRDDHQGSGSALIQLLKKQVPEALFIGVSAHYAQDREKLQEGGACLTWPKPPPPSACSLRNDILKKILILRGKEKAALQHFA